MPCRQPAFIESCADWVIPYIADLLGLYVIGTMMPSLKGAKEWRCYAAEKLDEELARQFDKSGVHCEGSPAYARLVIELYLFAYLLGIEMNDTTVLAWRPMLESAIDYLAALEGRRSQAHSVSSRPQRSRGPNTCE